MADPQETDAAADAWFAEAEVAIVGMGLMGGSLAGALRGGGGLARRCRRVVGVVRRASATVLAAALVDELTTDLAALATADAVVLAVPPGAILALLPTIAPALRPGALLTDLGSTKGAVVAAMASLRGDLLVVGGHPMCGKEAGGLAAAEPQLYQGAPFVLCPVAGRPPQAVARAAALARAAGAHPCIVDGAAHDRIVAAISHGPYAAAVALVAAAEQLAAGGDGDAVWRLAAGGFRDTTRVAAGELDMWVDILLTNRAEMLAHLDRVTGALAALALAIDRADAPGLRALLEAAQQRRRHLFP